MFEKSLCHVLMVNVICVVGAANTLAYFHVDELILVAWIVFIDMYWVDISSLNYFHRDILNQ